MKSNDCILYHLEAVKRYYISKAEVVKAVDIMYQAPEDNLIWDLNTIQNVILPMRYSGKLNGNEKARAEELLEKVGLKRKTHEKRTG